MDSWFSGGNLLWRGREETLPSDVSMIGPGSLQAHLKTGAPGAGERRFSGLGTWSPAGGPRLRGLSRRVLHWGRAFRVPLPGHVDVDLDLDLDFDLDE